MVFYSLIYLALGHAGDRGHKSHWSTVADVSSGPGSSIAASADIVPIYVGIYYFRIKLEHTARMFSVYFGEHTLNIRKS